MIQPYVVYKRHKVRNKKDGKRYPIHTVISKISDITDFKSKRGFKKETKKVIIW